MKPEIQDPKAHYAKVWDVGLRLFHWALALAVTAALVSGFEDKLDLIPGTGIEWGTVHLWSGVSVLALVLWRWLWGFAGSETARFLRFPLGPRRLLAYLGGITRRQPAAPAGHNPAGAVMVLVLLALLGGQAALGLFADDDIFFSGPLRGRVSSAVAGMLTGWHKTIGEVLPWLAGLHVAAALYYVCVRRRNIIAAMFTGRAWITGPAPRLAPLWRAALLALISVLGVYQLVFA